MHLDDLFIGQQNSVVLKADPLGAKQQLGGAQAHEIIATLEDITQHGVGHLVEKKLRRIDGVASKYGHIAALQAAVFNQAVAKGKQHPVVVGNIRIRQRGQSLIRHGHAGLVHELRMEAALGIAGLRLGPNFGTH